MVTMPVCCSSSGGDDDGRRVGILYEAWHAPAYWSMDNATNQHSVEAVLRSNGTKRLTDVFPSRPLGFSPGNWGFWWQATPLAGRYCIYRKRQDENQGYVPDCPNITQTLTSIRT